MLHICTPVYRMENIPLIYESIPKDSCIRWHIAHSSRVEEPRWKPPTGEFRVSVLKVDCLDVEIYKKRNAIFEKIKDGYFCLLDDDTLFHHGMYDAYRACSRAKLCGMYIGNQRGRKGKTRLHASIPIFTKIDTGNVLAHHSCLSACRWPSSHQEGVNQKDFIFWDSVYKHFGKKAVVERKDISFYNELRNETDIKHRYRGGKKRKLSHDDGKAGDIYPQP